MSTNTQTATFAEAQVSKQYFDVIVVVPLEEEFDVVLEYFGSVEDLSSATHIKICCVAGQPANARSRSQTVRHGQDRLSAGCKRMLK